MIPTPPAMNAASPTEAHDLLNQRWSKEADMIESWSGSATSGEAAINAACRKVADLFTEGKDITAAMVEYHAALAAKAEQSSPLSPEVIETLNYVNDQPEVPASVPQPLAGVITLLETFARIGMTAEREGRPTPNSLLCSRFAAELRAFATPVAERAAAPASPITAMLAKIDDFNQSEPLSYAQFLAWVIWRDNYQEASPNFEIMGELWGVLSQIDNMVSGIGRKDAAPASAAASDGCKFCLGAKGGVPGNENVIGGKVVCDYCTSLLLTIRDAERANPTGSVFATAAPASVLEGDADELSFNAQRLRNVAKLVGLESAVPQDDAELDGVRGAVLGMIAAKLRKAAAPEVAQPAAQGERNSFPPGTECKCGNSFNVCMATSCDHFDLATPAPTAGELSAEKGGAA